MHSKIAKTPNHETIIGIYEHVGFNKYAKDFYEITTLPLDEKLRIACQDLTPSLDETLNQRRLNGIKVLLAKGANPSLTDENGNNALMLLFQYCPNYRPSQSINSEIFAASNGLVDAVNCDKVRYITDNLGLRIYEDEEPKKFSELLKDEAQYYYRPNQSQLKAYSEKLHTQIENSKIEMANQAVKLLLENGIDINAKNHTGKTALMIADENNFSYLKEALLDHGANEFDLLKDKPEFSYLTDSTDSRNICRNWYNFNSLITQAVNNKTRDISEYPHVTMNKDGSLSFFFDSDDETYQKLNEFLLEDYFSKQLQFHSQKRNSSSKNIVELSSTHNITECRINLSAYELDEIMMLNEHYRGYRNENSLLKLNKDFVMKEGVIRLFPISKETIPTQHGEGYAVGVSGCQTYEIPSIQLMRLLPNYQSEIAPDRKKNGNHFHWIPDEVCKSLDLDRSNLPRIMNNLLHDNGIIVTEGNQKEFSEYPEFLIVNDQNKKSDIRIVEMDEASKDFYALYGILSQEKLKNYQSVEVDSLAFLQAIKEDLEKNQKDVPTAIQTLDTMIRNIEKPSSTVAVKSTQLLVDNLGKNSPNCCSIS